VHKIVDIPTRSFTDIVRDMSAAITASAGGLIDISIGSVLRAIIEANGAIVLWVQWLVLLALQTTRAATSSGIDLDSWMADFSLSRLSAVVATGAVTFSRYSGASSAFVPAGTMIKTQDGSVSFAVVVDPNNLTWQSSLNCYCLAAGVMSVDLPISAALAGSAGNVLANTITVLASAVPGIDFLTNAVATVGGEDPETDTALRTRFANFFAARSRATLDAVGYAISSVGSNLNYLIQENIDAAGNRKLGNMLIVVCDGSGSISDSLLSSLAMSIETVRPIGTTFSIQPPQIIQVQVNLSITLPTQLLIPPTQAVLQSSIANYINTRPIGGTLSITRISQLTYQTEPQIINVFNVMLNDQAVDLVAPIAASFACLNVTFI
jgi:uncharacterized phage protein gp47/JayE